MTDTNRFASQGYARIGSVLSPKDCGRLIERATQLPLKGAGSRNLLELSWCGPLATMLKQHPYLGKLLPPDAIAAQCTLFEKTTDKNWAVAINQDLSIPVRERVDSPACSGWARKEGVMYTQPPAEVLANLAAVRVHLDHCPAQAGPLLVVPGSHRHGRLPESEINRLRAENGEVSCTAQRGDALVMRPLLLHSSPRVEGARVRRVLHFLFGPRILPYGLRWHFAT